MFLPGLPEIMELEESRLMAQLRVELGYGRMRVQQGLTLYARCPFCFDSG